MIEHDQNDFKSTLQIVTKKLNPRPVGSGGFHTSPDRELID